MSEHSCGGAPTRRGFPGAAAPGIGAGAASGFQAAGGQQRLPLKLGRRAANMEMAGNLGVFRLARQIPGLPGVELQVTAGDPNLHDWETVRGYKREASQWGIMIPPLAGPWEPGVSILNSPAAGVNLYRVPAAHCRMPLAWRRAGLGERA